MFDVEPPGDELIQQQEMHIFLQNGRKGGEAEQPWAGYLEETGSTT
jgi:hypothetical protein